MKYPDALFMEQVITESGIKGDACLKSDCTDCDNLTNCYKESRKDTMDKDINYGGYETEMHY